ncbi:hypothetical protein BT93_B0528 [Corymbia citriodora subsp. variegata]|nr:hypothetical protein BT93_B0528 [Corymbia citriodora subsp. variegata]
MDNKTQKKVALKSRSHDPKGVAAIYLKSLLELMMELFNLGYAASSVRREQTVQLREPSEQNSELSMKLRAARKRGVELQLELAKCPIKGWWEAPIDQLSLEELKLHKRRYEELSRMLIQAIGDRATDPHSDNSSNLPKT